MSYDEMDDEYIMLRKKKEEELLKRLEAEKMIRVELSKILTPEALERLDFVSMTRPELANEAKLLIIKLVQEGRLMPPIDEDVVKKILAELYRRRSRGGRIDIRRK